MAIDIFILDTEIVYTKEETFTTIKSLFTNNPEVTFKTKKNPFTGETNLNIVINEEDYVIGILFSDDEQVAQDFEALKGKSKQPPKYFIRCLLGNDPNNDYDYYAITVLNYLMELPHAVCYSHAQKQWIQ